MAKIYRILGKRGNTTIPYALRVFLGFRPNDLLSFRAESDVFGVNNKFYDAAMLVLKEAVNDKYDYISWWLYEGEPDYKVWSSDNTEEWNLTEPEALYDFIVNECQE